MITVNKVDLINELSENTERSCGKFPEDHDWTIHIAAHTHYEIGNEPNWLRHGPRIVHVGGDSAAVALAIKTHPDLAYAECNWCATKWDNNGLDRRE